MSEEEVRSLLKSTRKLQAKKEVLSSLQKESEEYGRICRILCVIENALNALSNEEKEIIEMHLVQDCTWEEVMKQYEQKHGQAQGYSERTYKRIQQKGMKQMLEVLREVEIDKLH